MENNGIKSIEIYKGDFISFFYNLKIVNGEQQN